MRKRHWTTVWQYSLALLLVAAAATVTYMMPPRYSPGPFVPLYAAVVACAWIAGSRPGLIAAALATTTLAWLFGHPPSYVSQPDPLESGRPITFAAFAVVFALSTDALRRSQRQAAKSQALFDAFMKHCPAGAYLKDRQGRYVYVNREIEETFKRPMAQWLGHTDRDFWPDRVAENLRRRDQTVLESNESQQVIEETWHDGQTQHWLSLKFPMRDAAGQRLLAGMSLNITERIRGEEALRASEERFALAAQAANDGLWDWNIRTGDVYLSARWKEIVGFREDELANVFESWVPRVHPEDGPHVLSQVIAHLNGRLPRLESEHRLRHRDGSYRWVLWRGQCVRDERGAPYRMVGSVTDISASKQAEASLRDSERRFRALIENSSDLVVVGGTDGTIRYIGPSVRRVLGYEPAELVGTGVMDLVHEDDVARVGRGTDAVRRGVLAEASLRYRCRHKDGTWRWLESVCVRPPSSTDDWVLVVNSRDVTERVSAEEALRVSEERFALAAQAANEGLWDWDLRTGVVYLSPRARELVGIPVTTNALEVIKAWQQHTHPEDRERLFATYDAALTGGASHYEREYRVQLEDGGVRWLLSRSLFLRDAAGRAVRCVGALSDVTMRRQAEDAARQRQAELAHVLRVSTMGEMAAGLAHEINQPLAAIVNYARGGSRRLRAAGGDQAGLGEVLEEIAAEALRAGDILRRLREFVRKEPLRREPVDVNALVTDAVRLMRRGAMDASDAVDLELLPTLPPVNADRLQLQQVVLNLMRNGLEAMQVGGDAGRLRIRTTLIGEAVEVSVVDQGTGVPDSIRGRLFEPFFTTKQAGLGMGLSISRSIIDAHGGQLGCKSNSERGATFSFTVPLAAAPGASAAEGTRAGASAGRGSV
jgi:two-component system sensor kinase FixL